jgi:hypothetical protein
MKPILATSAIALLAFATPSLAQTPKGTTPTAPAPSQDSTLPESMQIQQRAQSQYFRSPMTPNTPTNEAPGNATSPLERNRLDPAAPSDKRLQIDQGQSARAIQNPDAATTNSQSNSSTSYNSVIRGAPSNSGMSNGASGTGASTGVSGSSAAPTTSPLPSASPSAGATSGGAASSAGSAGGGAASSGGGH